MLLGYFAILIFLNFRFWNRRIDWKVGCIIGGLFFGVFLPILSIVIELTRVELTSGPWMDSFEVVYTFLRFPTYWIVGIIQAIVIGINLSYTNKELDEPD